MDLKFFKFFKVGKTFLLNLITAKFYENRVFPKVVCLFSTSLSRGVAQPGSAPVLGTGGRKFESCRPDHQKLNFHYYGR